MSAQQTLEAPAAPAPSRAGELPAWLTRAWVIDLVYVIAVAGLALILRAVDLSNYPYGLHGDEAWTGLDARDIIDGRDLWPYTTAALGQPSGPMYWATIFVDLLGSTVLAVRLPMAIAGTATVVLGFFAIRELYGRPAAYIGAALLALSAWLIFYNRTGYTVSTMPFAEFASLLAVALALRKRWWPWSVGAGIVLGLGMYSYYSYPLFALGLGLYVLVHWAIERPQPWLLHARNVLVMGLTALVVLQPMWTYITSDDIGYRHDRKVFAVSNTPEYKEADSNWEKFELYWENAGDLADALLWHPLPDPSDGSGTSPALDPIIIVTAGAGLGLCAMLAIRRRRAAYLIPFIITPFVLFGPLWSEGGYHRRALGILPFVVIAASVFLAYAWERLRAYRPEARTAVTFALIGVIAVYGAVNLYRYFDKARDAQVMHFTYGPELTEAARFIRDEPLETKVYFASQRWGAGYETVRYLVPDRSLAEGNIEDRSKEFAPQGQDGFDNLDRSRPALIVLLGTYIDQAPAIAARYPGARIFDGPTIRNSPSFVALRVPPE